MKRGLWLALVAGCAWADVAEPNRATRLRPTVDESDLYNAIVEAVGPLQGNTNNPGPYEFVVTPTMLEVTLQRLAVQVYDTHGVMVKLRLRP